MALKRIFWSGPHPLWVLRGALPNTTKLVDERALTPSILQEHGDYLVVFKENSDYPEFVGKLVNKEVVSSLFPTMRAYFTPKINVVVEPVVAKPNNILEEVSEPAQEDVTIDIPTMPFESNEQIDLNDTILIERLEHKKRGRKKKDISQ